MDLSEPESTPDWPVRRLLRATPVGLPQHPDQHRPQGPVLLAVDQQLGAGLGASLASLGVGSVTTWVSVPSRNDIATVDASGSLVLRCSGSLVHGTVEMPAVRNTLQHVLTAFYSGEGSAGRRRRVEPRDRRRVRDYGGVCWSGDSMRNHRNP
jgi:hypothetical protein